MRCILLLCLFAICFSADEAQLPPAAQAAVEKSNAVVKKERDRLIAELGKMLVAETKKGNLDGANAINAKVQEFIDDSTDALGNPQITEKVLIGKAFTFINSDDKTYLATLTFDKNGKISGSPHPNVTSWAVEDGALVIKHSSGAISNQFTTISKVSGKLMLTGTFILGNKINVALTEK